MRSDARKRLSGHAEHPDPTVCQLIRGARAVTLNDCAHQLTEAVPDVPDFLLSDYSLGYNEALRFYAAVFTTAATEIQATT